MCIANSHGQVFSAQTPVTSLQPTLLVKHMELVLAACNMARSGQGHQLMIVPSLVMMTMGSMAVDVIRLVSI